MHFPTYLLVPQLVSALVINQRDSQNRAAYFLDDNPNGSSIVSLKINPLDGTLSDPIRTYTGGEGLQGLFMSATPGVPATPGAADPLFSQDAVLVSQDYLFTVNTGSNTVSMFFIDKNAPWSPRLINTASSVGEFPMSIAYSPKLKTTCVLNGGAKAGVACFSTDHAKGLTPLGSFLPIALGQTTPPVGPPGTTSDIVFNPSETALFVTIKGDPPSPGFIYVYPVTSSGTISSAPKISNPSELVVDFSISFLGSDSRAVITDASYGAAIVDVADDWSVTVEKKIVVAGQGASCWGAYSQRFNTVFIMDAGHSNITLVDPESGDIKGFAVQNAAGMGSFDTAQDQTYLYTLKGSPSISVSDLSGLTHGAAPKEIQSLDLSALGERATWTGMAIYPSS